MILDQFGKPVRKLNTFLTPDWLARNVVDLWRDSGKEWDEYTRLSELRESVGAPTGYGVGETITVKLPERFR